MFQEYTRQIDNKKKIDQALCEIPKNRLNIAASWMIKCFTDDEITMFVFEDLSLVDRIQTYIDGLLDVFSEDKLQEFVQEAVTENGYPEKMIQAAVEESYNKTGEIYHRSRLSLTSIYFDVMKSIIEKEFIYMTKRKSAFVKVVVSKSYFFSGNLRKLYFQMV